MVGRTVAQYQLTEKLGAGGMGEIYRALDTRLSRTVAIKVLPASHSGDPERRRRFLQEARAASALNHPNIITIHDVVYEGDTAFMVMEFVGGETLAERIAGGPMAVPEVVRYAVQIADALAAAHDAGIVHRDLKPANVMITQRGLVKVVDFGLAKRSVFGQSAGPGETTATAVMPLTIEGSILGTVSYMSPEQAEGRTVDGRSDIFSFGVMLYEMLTGKRPFTGDSTLSVLSSILRDDARSVSEQSAVPRHIDDVVRKCLAKRPENRWQNMHQLRDALAALERVPGAPRTPQRFPKVAVAAVGAAFLLAGVVYFTTGKGRPAPSGPAQAPNAVAAPNAAAPAPAAGDVLTNEQVLSMLRAKVEEPVIAQQIRSSRTNFDLSVAAVIRLTEAGASSDLIATMRDPKRSTPAATQPKPAASSTAGAAAAGSSPVVPPPAPAAPAAPAAAPPTPSVAVTIPDALPIQIELAEDIPADAEAGRPVHFTVSKALQVGDQIVAPAHADVIGEIVEGEKKKLIGGTKLTFRLKTVTAVGGANLNVRISSSGRDNRRAVDSGSGPKPPKGVAAVIGTGYLAYTSGEQSISIPAK